jgi:hypothetical protein
LRWNCFYFQCSESRGINRQIFAGHSRSGTYQIIWLPWSNYSSFGLKLNVRIAGFASTWATGRKLDKQLNERIGLKSPFQGHQKALKSTFADLS